MATMTLAVDMWRNGDGAKILPLGHQLGITVNAAAIPRTVDDMTQSYKVELTASKETTSQVIHDNIKK